ncbi:hypothetical protein ACGF1Z_27740 [Streptomyces sp. NPDC048018]|uniref:hypothetical protein n=1 Tax=Streptomyces sp. NPDC048018 TaxID=3365499 RepID=UPI00371237F5
MAAAPGRRGVELVLAVMLFTDATETRDYARLRGPVGGGRLLGIALPASLVLAGLFGALCFPGTNGWLLAVMALVVMPIDLAPVLSLLRDEHVRCGSGPPSTSRAASTTGWSRRSSCSASRTSSRPRAPASATCS